MNIYDWFKIFNKDDFFATNLVSRMYQVNLEGRGIVQVLALRGNLLSVQFNGELLSHGITGQSIVERSDIATYLDANNDVWIGYKVGVG